MAHSLLFLGLSRIVRNRVLPAALGSGLFSSVSVATRSNPDAAAGLAFEGVFRDYLEALEGSDADWVYISLPNGLHAEWIGESLKRGFHVMVDKPAVMDPRDGARLLGVARESGLCLSEAIVFGHHAQIEAARRVFAEDSDEPREICGFFSIPPLADADFRNDPTLGGGPAFDLGPYAMGMGSVFFGSRPLSVDTVVRGGRGGMSNGFSMIAEYPGERVSIGHFGFDSEYVNELTLLGSRNLVRIPRVFSTPSSLQNTISGRSRNEPWELTVPPSDSFAAYLRWCVTSFEQGRGEIPLEKFAESNADMGLFLESCMRSKR